MIRLIHIVLMFLLVKLASAQIKTDTLKPFIIGETRIIKSLVLDESRTLNIYLPINYTKAKKYPVIYLLDGSANEDFLHIVGLTQFFNMQYKMPEFIIVGIANVDRKRDFTFNTEITELKKDFPTTGGSAKFISFIATELKPFINSTYTTNDTSYIIGQSLGGLLATEILIKKPTLFTHYFIISPSLWWDDQSLLQQIKPLLKQPLNAYVYISVGGKEHKIMKRDAKNLFSMLKKTHAPNLKIDFLKLPNENHATILHQSINEAFKKIYPYK
jgi:predicted alpha/beta superfamily hydrolase